MTKPRWPKPCDDSFIAMSIENPARLITWLKSGSLSVAHMSLAAEALGKSEEPIAVPVLLELLKHDLALIREGAVLGLYYFQSDEIVKTHLIETAKNDKSPAVKNVAKDVIHED